MHTKHYLRDQGIALSLTVVVCAVLIGLVFVEVALINYFLGYNISLAIRPFDVLVGLTIYLKTSIDFAIFVAQLMAKNPGLKGRIGIEIGSALGNGVGTMAILIVWAVFKQIDWLLAVMIIVASFVLLRLAEDSLVESLHNAKTKRPAAQRLARYLSAINKLVDPILRRIIPSRHIKVETRKKILSLLALSFTIPFILGMDNFAGYIPVFDFVNIFGFMIGIFIGHMLLNIALYISPGRTIKVIGNPVIAFVGSVVFVLLASWGFYEAIHILLFA